MYLITTIVCFVVLHDALLFTNALTSSRVPLSKRHLEMGGGKNEGEKVQTKKEMFRDLREKLNDAAQIPGFFDVGQKMVCEHIERHIESLSW